jgi:hypothetical protein
LAESVVVLEEVREVQEVVHQYLVKQQMAVAVAEEGKVLAVLLEDQVVVVVISKVEEAAHLVKEIMGEVEMVVVDHMTVEAEEAGEEQVDMEEDLLLAIH